tara:strand:- start:299 stop:958 length:660 start_codon:yes stop_codon:yes gene_type:complete
MSTIGTTLKQPRVFAHDAIALADLCAAEEGILTLATSPIAPPSTAGTGYTTTQVYETTSDGDGTGATVKVLSIGGGGAVATFELTFHGDGYAPGDILTLVGGTPASGDDCTIAVATVGCTWQLGDPITPMPSNFNTVPYWNNKSSYTYTSAATGNPGPHQTPGPGAALYVGTAMDITVINEATTEVEYKGVNAGSFLPVSVLSVVAQSDGGLNDVLALF